MLGRLGNERLRILDLGCGGGWEFLKEFGDVTGVDYSRQAVEAAAAVYDRVLRTPLDRLPLADRSIDVVVSVWCFEHLPDEAFVAMLREVRRVLRVGGHLICFADLDSEKPILRWAKGFPDDYRRHHVDKIGHYGLRTLARTRQLLSREGFRESATVPVNKSSLLQPVTALWMFDNELGRRSRILTLYVRACRWLVRSRAHRPVYWMLMEYHRLADRLLPDRYAFSAAFDWHTTEQP
jgi:SAM-dependent methyltransferase